MTVKEAAELNMSISLTEPTLISSDDSMWCPSWTNARRDYWRDMLLIMDGKEPSRPYIHMQDE